MKLVTFKVRKITVLRLRYSPDRIYMEFEGPTPFPTMGDEASLAIQTSAGYAEQWLSSMGLTADEVINPDAPEHKFSERK